MATYNRNAYTPDTGLWKRTLCSQRLGSTLGTIRETILAQSQGDQFSGADINKLVVDPSIKASIESTTESDGTSTVSYARLKCRDTTVGGNDAWNPLYQYCEFDDLGTNFTAGINGSDFMGRVYSENIDDYQQILWLAFGMPMYNNLRGFYNKAVTTGMSAIAISGPSAVSAGNIGKLVGSATATVVSLPILPLHILSYLYNNVVSTPISRYYDFRNEMPLYFRMANTIVLILATNLGFRDYEYKAGKYSNATTTETGSVISNSTTSQLLTSDATSGDKVLIGTEDNPSIKNTNNLQKSTVQEVVDTGMPDWVDLFGLDLFYINNRRGLYEGYKASNLKSTDFYLLNQTKTYSETSNTNQTTDSNGNPVDTSNSSADKSWVSNAISGFFSSASNSLYNRAMYVGFRVDKSTQATESISNQTGPSEIKSTMNSKFGQLQNATFAAFNGNLDDGILGKVVGGTLKAASEFVSGVVEGIGLVGGASSAATGAVRFDIPDIWTDSSFTKSYNFNLSLRAPYGNTVCILQDLYIPLALILAGSLPKMTGASSYTSPFLCQAYSKGLFSVPLGMIDNVTISRAHDQHGLTLQRLPTSIDISFSIKDMSPTMYLSLGDGYGLFDAFIGNTNSMTDYLATLSGMGLLEKTDRSGFRDWARRFKIWQNVKYYNKFNPYYYGASWGTNTVFRTFLQMGMTNGNSY